MIQVASCEQASIEKKETIQKHQSKTLLPFKTFTLEFEFDKHLKHMFICQGMWNGLPLFLVGKFGTSEIFFAKMAVWTSPIYKHKIDHFLDRI